MPNLVKAEPKKEPKSSNLVLCEVFWFRLFFGNTFGSLTIFWFYFGSYIDLPEKDSKLLKFSSKPGGQAPWTPEPPISDYFFLLFYKFVSFLVPKKMFFGSKSKNLLTTLFSQSVIRSAHFCTETDYWFTVTFTDLGIYLHNSQWMRELSILEIPLLNWNKIKKQHKQK